VPDTISSIHLVGAMRLGLSPAEWTSVLHIPPSLPVLLDTE
jgi:hypothetical protein